MTGVASANPRVALTSVWLGRVQRGFERFFRDLFGVLQKEMDITLFKGGGTQGPSERIPPRLGPARAVARCIPLARRTDRREYKRDCLAFGMCLLPELLRGRYDVVHCIDPPLARMLPVLKRAFRLRGRLLFSEACVMPPELYPPVSHVHHIAQVWHQNALDWGIRPSDMTMVPCGVWTERFVARTDRAELRRRYGVSENTFVILVVSNLDRRYKRVDHVIEEVARLEGDILLWIDGNPEDATLVELARNRLGSRCRVTHVSSADVSELYGLADVFVHASLSESFGLVIVEALSSGLMVLAHDCRHFEWLTGDRECLVDMSVGGALERRLRELMRRPSGPAARAGSRAAAVRGRFDWRELAPRYKALYHKVAALHDGTTVGR